jgi:hypothetical protein
MKETGSVAVIDLHIANGTLPMTDPNAISRFQELFGDLGTFTDASSSVEVFPDVFDAEIPNLQHAQEPFTRSNWIDLLVKYLVVSNLPFSEVDVPEFRDLINYTYRGAQPINIPGADTIKRRVIKLSRDTIFELKQLFQVSDWRHQGPPLLFSSPLDNAGARCEVIADSRCLDIIQLLRVLSNCGSIHQQGFRAWYGP